MSNSKIGVFRVAAAAVIINDENQVLLTQRGLDRDHHPGEWEILSGRLDEGEGFEDALKREAYEELKIELKIVSILNTFHFFRGPEKVEHVGVAFLAKYTGGEIVVDGVEEVDYSWMSFAEAIAKVNDGSIKDNLIRAVKYIEDLVK